MTDGSEETVEQSADKALLKKRNLVFGLFAIALIMAALITKGSGHSFAATFLMTAEIVLAVIFLALALYSTEECGQMWQKIKKIIWKDKA
jgi:hypothetical protein